MEVARPHDKCSRSDSETCLSQEYSFSAIANSDLLHALIELPKLSQQESMSERAGTFTPVQCLVFVGQDRDS